MVDIPDELLRRIALAKAKALGEPYEEIPGISVGDGEPVELPDGVEPTPEVPATIPEELVEREAAWRDATLASLPPVPVRDTVPKKVTPKAKPREVPETPQPTVEPTVEPAVSPSANVSAIPEKLLRRSAEAKAKALGVPLEQVLAEMLGGAAPAEAVPAAAPSTAAAVAREPVSEPAASAVVPEAAVEGVSAPATEVTPAAAEDIQPEEVDLLPALFKIEFFAAIVSAVFLVLLALAAPAPLFAPASGVVDPSKAPWYLLWIQQLLAWLHPQVAGFYVPLLILVGLFAIPFIDHSTNREDRRVGLLVFGIFVLALIVLTILGFIARTSGFGYPWIVG
ncbi:hypothetical protein BMS3Abin02_01164 [bacterium BMS3Abin02]|nr:hypothetical protein BMS3Abin02_01164 [bacterium BMS3Abin02]